MSLLAEGKKKLKYGLDPQNTHWSRDDSKFGQRLMEKMGWEKGKGLGANENGITEHIKASYKWDQRGLGATAKSADAWVAHQDDFNDLLKMLNSGNQDEKQEEKDKKTEVKDGHKRYYGRFSRGRVQTLRTTEDLDCIFGRRKSASAPVTPSNQSAANSGDEASDEDKDKSGSTTEKSHGLTTVTSSTSVQEYFAKKMSEMKARQKLNSNPVGGDSFGGGKAEKRGNVNSPAPPVYGRVGFSYSDDEDNKSEDKECTKHSEEEAVELPSRGWYQDWNLGKREGETQEKVDDETVRKSKKKKKDKKKKIVDSNDKDSVQLEDSISTDLDANKNSEVKERISALQDKFEGESLPKKRKKKKSVKEAEKEENWEDSIGNSKLSSKKNKLSREENVRIDDNETEEKMHNESIKDDSEVVDGEMINRSKKSKKKKRKKGNDEIEEVEISSKKRKASYKLESGDNITSKSEEEDINVDSEHSMYESKKKGRKSFELQGHTNQIRTKTDDSTNPVTPIEQNDTRIKKKKTKKIKDTSFREDETVLDTEEDLDNSNDRAVGSCDNIEETSPSSTLPNKSICNTEISQSNNLSTEPPKSRKSMFPGSNFEELHGYGERKVVEKAHRTQRKADIENPQKRKVKIGKRFLVANDVNDEWRDIAKYQTRTPGEQKTSAPKR
ncbi:pin2/terf1-interacting telomerase inhibitor 1-like [Plakobranchus ocellatus]|uniref:Pin2/terf1-interacting telomerase inhibitor 1-like n=1 Tax=Plakobranchus ocellatus TaxID=259542 RepID=A0AAV4E380_9GAST|nr:pin2/terf1-interacting telomerase inhibitor 1-like [Plakobranchus ocellatus]